MPLQWISPTFSRLRKRARTDAALARAADLVRMGAGVPRTGESMGKLNAELDRARRYEHTLAVAILAPRRATGSVEVNGDPTLDGEPVMLETHMPGLVSLLAGSLIREALRESDILAYDAFEDRFVVLLAQTEEEEARDALVRLERIVRMRLRLATSTGMALFPRDGLTMDDLLASAEKAWRDRPLELDDLETAQPGGAEHDGAGPTLGEQSNGDHSTRGQPRSVAGDRR